MMPLEYSVNRKLAKSKLAKMVIYEIYKSLAISYVKYALRNSAV